LARLTDRYLSCPTKPFHYPAPGQPVDELAAGRDQERHSCQAHVGDRQGTPGWRPSTTGTRPRRWRCAIRIVHRWLTVDKQSYDAGSKRVYYLSLEFLIGRLFTDAPQQYGPVKGVRDPRSAISASALTSCGRWNRMRRSAMAVSGGSPPASWKAWRRWAIPRNRLRHPLYDFGLFRQIIDDGWQKGISRRLAELRQPLGIAAAGKWVYHVHFGGGVEHIDDKGRRPRAIWHPGGDRGGDGFRHARSSAGAANTSMRSRLWSARLRRTP